ncbi:hypothetical protein EMQ25_05200 [Arsenicitalea aurantiaca]|uniref:O-antigen ligase-related domain-containing protein n=1 Tax=Arsenicitalea aurantiaca TaxID=1783274 RepID=A0A433XEQ6_9HYPH|nr:O-antigen ligase family protein [Arsenicitalea aurantiaca]RUT32552.1 hypothetical protein EMQ25_05200 [Arsenicitalea aurantiaca]
MSSIGATGVAAPGWSFITERAAALLHVLVACWIFSGGLVMAEPSPYELVFLVVLAVSLLGGFALHRATLGLLVLFVAFIPFATIAAFQVRYVPLTQALIFSLVTIFLIFTGYFVANYVADAPQRRTRLIVRAYIAIALISAVLGTLGYLGLIPRADLFTLYGRAKALFKDPNVYGPFLVLPAMYALQRVLLGSPKRMAWGAVIFVTLFIGVFASFSRAAWGHFVVSAALVYFLVFVLEAHARDKVRMLLLALGGLGLLVVALAGLLSIPEVGSFFEMRAGAQSYDQGETGRFGRQGYAFELALANPLGIGPLEFRNLLIMEEPHNTYVNVLHVYGWGGGLVYIAMILVTLWRGAAALAYRSPNRLLLIPLMATYVPLCIEAAIIDTDHWRHFFLVTGLIWGVTAAYQRAAPHERGRLSALV